MFFVVYNSNNKPMQLTADKKGLQEVKTIKMATVFSEEYKKYFDSITKLYKMFFVVYSKNNKPI